MDNMVLVKGNRWSLKGSQALLIEHQILKTKRADTPTIERKIPGVSGKHRYFTIDEIKLSSFLTPDNDIAETAD